jgi:2'-5' RNA ligase
MSRLIRSPKDSLSTIREPQFQNFTRRKIHIQLNIGGDTNEDIIEAMEFWLRECRNKRVVTQRAKGTLTWGLECVLWLDPTMTREKYMALIQKQLKKEIKP